MIDAIEQEQRKLSDVLDIIAEENGSDSDMADGSDDDGESNEELARLYRVARRSEYVLGFFGNLQPDHANFLRKRISKQKFE
jgi:hypothetical protein